jgi:hypothetical protein
VPSIIDEISLIDGRALPEQVPKKKNRSLSGKNRIVAGVEGLGYSFGDSSP